MTDKIKEIIIKKYSEYLGVNPDDTESMIKIYGPYSNCYRIEFMQEEYIYIVLYFSISLHSNMSELYQVKGELYFNKQQLKSIFRYDATSRKEEIASNLEEMFYLSLQKADSFLYLPSNSKREEVQI